MQLETLKMAMGNTLISDEELAGYNDAMAQAGCTTVNRSAMFAAQIGHESKGLRHYSEIWGPSSDQLSYEWRPDLGNRGNGDGYRYRGSGPLQVTGRGNFLACSQWAFEHGYVDSPTKFVDFPDMLRSGRYGFYGAAWFWSTHPGINAAADVGDVTAATRIINGGTNGLPDRINRWNTCRSLGAALLPEEGFLMGLDNGKQDTVWSGAAQVNGPSSKVRRAARWLIKFLPPSFDWTKNPDGPWVRDEIDAIVNEVVTGVFTFAPTDTIDFEDGKGPVKLVDVDPSTPVNFVTLLRIIAAKQVGGK